MSTQDTEIGFGPGLPFLIYPEGDYYVTLLDDGQVIRTPRPKYPAVDPVQEAVNRRIDRFKFGNPL